MLRAQVVIGSAVLLLAAVAARADVPKTVTLFGTEYNVNVQSRAGTFKNGVKISAQTPTADVDTKQKANLSFGAGGDASGDRLFVAAPIGGNDDGPTGDQFYMLKGTDASGLFSPAVSEATQFFGGNVDRTIGGRPNTVTFISDVDTGPKKDRNIAATTFTDDDYLRFYDLDTLKGGDFVSDMVFGLGVPSVVGVDNTDPAMPFGGWIAGAVDSKGTLVMIARSEGNASIDIGAIDPTKDKFFNVKTDLPEATGAKIDPPEQIPTSLARVGEDEYWMLVSEGDPGGNNDSSGQQNIYRLKITLPADLAKAEPGSIKAEVLGVEDLTSRNLHQSDGGMFGMTVGRELAPGKRVVYFADWVGNLITLSPVLPTAGP